MNRTRIYKAIYLGGVVGGSLTLAWVIVHYQLKPLQIALIFIAGLIPGRILGFFWRDLLRGLRLLKQKDYAASKLHSERFLAELEKKPWLRHFIWLGFGTYSRDPKSLALGNLGAAELRLGEITPAQFHFQEAMDADPRNPLPYFNMGVLLHSQGNSAEALRYFEEAVARGFSRSMVDRIIMAAQARFAATDGR